jgi:hypothetical protein
MPDDGRMQPTADDFRALARSSPWRFQPWENAE